MIKIRYAIHRKSSDRFPIHFRAECERTFFDSRTGQDESLIDIITRLDKADYDLVDELPDWCNNPPYERPQE